MLRGGLVIAALGLALALFRISGIDHFFSIQTLAENRVWLLDEVQRLGVVAAVLFVALYALAIGLSFPGSAVMTIAGGFLFGPLLGSVYAVTGATLGAIALFLLVRMGLGDAMRSRAGGTIERLRRGFSENALGYLLFLRILPVFPFWLVNLAAALLRVPLRSFTIATAVGIIPGSAVYASFGSGLGSLLDEGKPIDLSAILTPEIVVPFVALAALALAPALYQRLARLRRAA
ncbi:MAG: TVP38/TMEM64 family protein [Bauldia sp.]|nr:TVP38/TMEM64 family protein [Bauldia sp.]